MSYAFRIIRRHKLFGQAVVFISTKIISPKNTNSDKINQAQKNIEKFLLESRTAISLFEFREIVARYVGLSLAGQIRAARTAPQEQEIFRAAQTDNIELAAVCLKRRNRKRLVHHQTEAKQDFLQSIGKIYDSVSERAGFECSAMEIVKSLEDLTAQTALEKMFAANWQTDNQSSVEHLEKDLWNTKTHKPPIAKTISTRLQPMSTAANSRGKD